MFQLCVAARSGFFSSHRLLFAQILAHVHTSVTYLVACLAIIAWESTYPPLHERV